MRVVSYMLQSPNATQGDNPSTNYMGSWMGHTAYLETADRKKSLPLLYWEPKSDSPVT